MTPKRIAVATTAGMAAVAAAAGLATTSATAAPDGPTGQRVVFHLDGRTAHRSFFGKNAEDPQPGDRLTEYASLRQHGKVVGRFMNACLFVVGGPKANDDVCNGVIEVGGNQIILDGSGDPSVVPIVGGTGPYAFAAGVVRDSSTATGATFTVIYRTVKR